MFTRASIASLLYLASSPGLACSPVYHSVDGEIFHWDVIFDGRVASVSSIERDPRSLIDWARSGVFSHAFGENATDVYGCRVSYFVAEGFRGANQPIIEVIREASFEPVDCTDLFRVSDNELVFAMVDDNGVVFQPPKGNCQLPVSGSEDDIRETARRLRAEMRIW
jgi:hypothetical protein